MPHIDADNPLRNVFGALLLGCSIGLAGCGVQAYEERLNNANDLFTYQNRLDQVLTKQTWVSPDASVSMRVPLGYTQIPGPPPVKEGEEEAAEPAPDPRQPTYLGVPEIEGLIGAWKVAEKTRDGSGAATVYLYVLGNQERILNSGPGKEGLPPEEYLQHLESVLQMQLGVSIESGQSGNEPNTKYRVAIPSEEKYVRRKDFDTARLVPPPEALQNLGLPENVKLEAYLYEHNAAPVQLAVLLVAPLSIASPESALKTALETLNVEPPRRAAPGEAAPGRGSF